MLRVRGMEEADAPHVSAMAAELNAAEGYDRATAPDAAALRGAFLGGRPAGRVLVAESEAGLLGYLTLHATYATELAQSGFYVGDLYVLPQARRGGVGRALMAEAARIARAEGHGFLWWTALPQNAAGLAFYRAVGAEVEPLLAYTLTGRAFARLAGEEAT